MSSHALCALVLALAASAAGTNGQAQQLALAGRKPRFVAAWELPRKIVDVSNAAALRRRVTLDLGKAPIALALSEISQQAGVELSYTPMMLPAERRVSLRAEDITVVAALTEVLLDTGLDVAVGREGGLTLVAGTPSDSVIQMVVASDTGSIVGRVTDKVTGAPLAGAAVIADPGNHAVSAGADGQYKIANLAAGTYNVRARYIGFAPVSAHVAVAPNAVTSADFALVRSVQVLDELVTVTPGGAQAELKAVPSAVTVVSASDIEDQKLHRIDQVFRGQVPGSIAWDQPTRDHFSIVNIRGTSTFGLGTAKTFVDGIEVADPSYLALIDPKSVSRVEILRGPQASTVYGSGAINGVIQIFTKRGESGSTQPRLDAGGAVGLVPGEPGNHSAARQDYSAGVSGGFDRIGYNLNGSYSDVGDWIPQYYSHSYNLSGGAKAVQGPVTVDVSARFAAKNFGRAWLTALRDSGYTTYLVPPDERDQLSQQTYGVRLSVAATPRWSHSLTLGYDRVSNEFFNTRPRFTTPDDSLLQVYSGQTGRASLAYNTTLQLSAGRAIGASITAGADYFNVKNDFYYTGSSLLSSGTLGGSFFVVRTPYDNVGYFAQAQVGVSDALFLTAGLRGDHNTNFGADYGTALSPRAGLSYSRVLGTIRLKARASYGEATRAPTPDQRQGGITPYSIQLPAARLGPERQRGVDGGLELYLSNGLSVSATYYNQTAIDLVDNVLLDAGADGSLPTYQNQNVGRIKNKGLECEAAVDLSGFRLAGTYSITRSTVQRLSPTYTGDLQVGDRLLGIPSHTAGVTLTVTALRATTLTGQLTHVGAWTWTDDVALAGVYYGGRTFRGSNRDYWLRYPAFTKLNLGASRTLTDHLATFVRVENVGNSRSFESDNLNVPLGRVGIVGASVRY